MSNRTEFLQDFLGALGAETVAILYEDESCVKGTVIYDSSDSDERQDFCWHVSESESPSKEVAELATLLKEKKLLDIDRVSVSKEELLSLYNERCQTTLNMNQFQKIMDSLKCVKVEMVDNGEETDQFFIHE